MATARATVSYPHVTRTPGVCGGRARIEGTRLRVYNIAFMHKNGDPEATIRKAYPDLSGAQIHAAIAYYYDNQEEIDADLAEDEAWADSLER